MKNSSTRQSNVVAFFAALLTTLVGISPSLRANCGAFTVLALCVLQLVFIWARLMLATVLREMELDSEKDSANKRLGKAERAQKLWSILRSSVLLSCLNIASQRNNKMEWLLRWLQVTKARQERQARIRTHKLHMRGIAATIVGPFYVYWITLAITFQIHGFFTVVMPLSFASTFWHMLLGVFMASLSLKILVDYCRTALKDPGVVIVDEHRQVDNSPQYTKWCAPCGHWKPPRCHHCRVCRRCVEKMDHHCLVVNSCIGSDNFSAYFFGMLETIVAAFVVLISVLPSTLAIISDILAGLIHFQNYQAHDLHVVCIFVCALFCAMGLTPLWTFHLRLVASDETTLEWRRRSSKGVVKGERFFENLWSVCQQRLKNKET